MKAIHQAIKMLEGGEANAALALLKHTVEEPEDAEAIREEARAVYASPSNDDIEIDEGAVLSPGDSGTWVQAWVWVAKNRDGEA